MSVSGDEKFVRSGKHVGPMLKVPKNLRKSGRNLRQHVA